MKLPTSIWCIQTFSDADVRWNGSICLCSVTIRTWIRQKHVYQLIYQLESNKEMDLHYIKLVKEKKKLFLRVLFEKNHRNMLLVATINWRTRTLWTCMQGTLWTCTYVHVWCLEKITVEVELFFLTAIRRTDYYFNAKV